MVIFVSNIVNKGEVLLPLRLKVIVKPTKKCHQIAFFQIQEQTTLHFLTPVTLS